jgi:hypothetical protein
MAKKAEFRCNIAREPAYFYTKHIVSVPEGLEVGQIAGRDWLGRAGLIDTGSS